MGQWALKPHWQIGLGLVLAVSVLFAGQMAVVTRFDTHPDEAHQVDTFCYFAEQAWPPPLNADGFYYSFDGVSRVFYPEAVYWVYGRLLAFTHLPTGVAGVLAQRQFVPPSGPQQVYLPLVMGGAPWICFYGVGQPAAGAATIQFYVARVLAVGYAVRALNVALYALTLAVLWGWSRRHPVVAGLALVLALTPQVTYVYAYANSDAWALSVAVLLFAYALTEPQITHWRAAVSLGGLIGLLLVAKQTLWVVLPLAGGVAGWRVWHAGLGRRPRALVGYGSLVVVTAVVILAPWRIFYPLSQGEYAQKQAAMLAARSAWNYQPDRPLAAGLRLAARGYPITAVANQSFYEVSWQSLYAYFGYMRYPVAGAFYQFAALSLLLNATATYGVLAWRWRAVPPLWRWLLLSAPLFVLAPLGVSVLFSWLYAVQAQGRYLFAALLPIAVLLSGTFAFEPRWLRWARLGNWAALAGCAWYILQTAVLNNQFLR